MYVLLQSMLVTLSVSLCGCNVDKSNLRDLFLVVLLSGWRKKRRFNSFRYCVALLNTYAFYVRLYL